MRYEYGSGSDDSLSRPSFLAEDNAGSVGTHLADYDYMGLAALVKQEYVTPGVELDYSAGSYDSLDRFGRVTKQKWTDGSTGTYDNLAYGHDRLGNRTTRENLTTTSPHLDQAYTYDDLNRLVDADEGDLSSGTISAPTKQQEWGLDAGGNWNTFKDDNDANADWELEQTRVHNKANEIEDDTAPVDAITDWTDPVQDAVGNLTFVPKPDNLTSGFGCKFDAWNRLVEIKLGAAVVESYEFDGLHRRIEKHTEYVSGSATDVYDYFYDGHQVVEEHLDDDATYPIAQYVWHPHYIDALAVRYYDANTNGTLDGDTAEGGDDDGTHYYLQDANFNVTAVVAVITDGEDDITTVLERYHYTPYGEVTTYDAAWANPSTLSRIGNPYLYTGRRLDAKTGIYHYRTRPYHAQLGRFMGRDWIEYWGDDVNLYNYVGNGPLNGLDPWGLAEVIPQKVVTTDDAILWDVEIHITMGVIFKGDNWAKGMYGCLKKKDYDKGMEKYGITHRQLNERYWGKKAIKAFEDNWKGISVKFRDKVTGKTNVVAFIPKLRLLKLTDAQVARGDFKSDLNAIVQWYSKRYLELDPELDERTSFGDGYCFFHHDDWKDEKLTREDASGNPDMGPFLHNGLAHEFGHYFGLGHPSQGDPNTVNDIREYFENRPRSIMGAGKEIYPDDAATAFGKYLQDAFPNRPLGDAADWDSSRKNLPRLPGEVGNAPTWPAVNSQP